MACISFSTTYTDILLFTTLTWSKFKLAPADLTFLLGIMTRLGKDMRQGWSESTVVEGGVSQSHYLRGGVLNLRGEPLSPPAAATTTAWHCQLHTYTPAYSSFMTLGSPII